MLRAVNSTFISEQLTTQGSTTFSTSKKITQHFLHFALSQLTMGSAPCWLESSKSKTSSTKFRARTPQFHYQGQDISTLTQAGSLGLCWAPILQSLTQMQEAEPQAALQSQSNDSSFPKVPACLSHSFPTLSGAKGQGQGKGEKQLLSRGIPSLIALPWQ